MKVPYVYINGECINDKYKIQEVNMKCGRIIIKGNRFSNGQIIEQMERDIYFDQNDIYIKFVEKEV